MTKEEERVLDIALALAMPLPDGSRLIDVAHSRGKSIRAQLIAAVETLDASRAPKRPMTAEERVKCWTSGFDRRCLLTNGDVLKLNGTVRAAESAAWDRAIERAAELCEVIYQATYAAGLGRHPSLDIKNLLGKCHEAAP